MVNYDHTKDIRKHEAVFLTQKPRPVYFWLCPICLFFRTAEIEMHEKLCEIVRAHVCKLPWREW